MLVVPPAADIGEHRVVVVVFEGDPDVLVTVESDSWESFGGLDCWNPRRYEGTDECLDSLLARQREVKGEVGGEWECRLEPLAARLSLAYLREFEDPLPAV